jgi:hypothetical protein
MGPEAEDLWWLIAKVRRSTTALIKLYELYQARGDTPGLCRASELFIN